MPPISGSAVTCGRAAVTRPGRSDAFSAFAAASSRARAVSRSAVRRAVEPSGSRGRRAYQKASGGRSTLPVAKAWLLRWSPRLWAVTTPSGSVMLSSRQRWLSPRGRSSPGKARAATGISPPSGVRTVRPAASQPCQPSPGRRTTRQPRSPSTGVPRAEPSTAGAGRSQEEWAERYAFEGWARSASARKAGWECRPRAPSAGAYSRQPASWSCSRRCQTQYEVPSDSSACSAGSTVSPACRTPPPVARPPPGRGRLMWSERSRQEVRSAPSEKTWCGAVCQ